MMDLALSLEHEILECTYQIKENRNNTSKHAKYREQLECLMELRKRLRKQPDYTFSTWPRYEFQAEQQNIQQDLHEWPAIFRVSRRIDLVIDRINIMHLCLERFSEEYHDPRQIREQHDKLELIWKLRFLNANLQGLRREENISRTTQKVLGQYRTTNQPEYDQYDSDQLTDYDEDFVPPRPPRDRHNREF